MARELRFVVTANPARFTLVQAVSKLQVGIGLFRLARGYSSRRRALQVDVRLFLGCVSLLRLRARPCVRARWVRTHSWAHLVRKPEAGRHTRKQCDSFRLPSQNVPLQPPSPRRWPRSRPPRWASSGSRMSYSFSAEPETYSTPSASVAPPRIQVLRRPALCRRPKATPGVHSSLRRGSARRGAVVAARRSSRPGRRRPHRHHEDLSIYLSMYLSIYVSIFLYPRGRTAAGSIPGPWPTSTSPCAVCDRFSAHWRALPPAAMAATRMGSSPTSPQCEWWWW
jgi:hypothetical protein